MSVNRLYDTLFSVIRQLHPDQHISRVKTFTQMVVGIYLSRSVHLPHIAAEIPSTAKLKSQVMKLCRWLQNPKLRVRQWYRPVAKMIVTRVAQSRKRIRLIIDSTKIGFGHQLLVVAVSYRGRAIPLDWTWVNTQRGHSSEIKQMALLSSVAELIENSASVSRVGDSEFGGISVLQKLDEWG